MTGRLALLTAFLLPLTASGETIHFEIYDLVDPGKPVLIAAGRKKYSFKDIRTIEKGVKGGQFHFVSALPLAKGFEVGASIYAMDEPRGFGLWAENKGEGFSWEWFNPAGPGKYKKLQEGGVLSVKFAPGPLSVISELSFDTDVWLRLNETDDLERVTKRVLLKKGSVLKFDP